MRLILLLLVLLVASSGCAMYQAQNMEDQIALIKAQGGSGCLYFRGNARPYADISMMAVSAWGDRAPKYDECLKLIPPEARMFIQ
jgi:hypothetical protein